MSDKTWGLPEGGKTYYTTGATIRNIHDSMLEQLFGSRTRVKLLRLFLVNSGEQFFVREITRRIDEQINSVRRELANLEDLGLLEEKTKDRKRYYRLNTACILYPELRALILKSRIAIEQNLVAKLKNMGSISFVTLTGVFTGVEDAKTDVLIVGRVNRKQVRSLMKKLQVNFDSEIRYTVMNLREFNYRRDITDRFLYTILENKRVTLIDRLKSPLVAT
ncbi:MAG: winged helix-turn-helix domain-containing protein [bacterium]